jgi:uncharacterized protein YbbC (DUF1343 family)
MNTSTDMISVTRIAQGDSANYTVGRTYPINVTDDGFMMITDDNGVESNLMRIPQVWSPNYEPDYSTFSLGKLYHALQVAMENRDAEKEQLIRLHLAGVDEEQYSVTFQVTVKKGENVRAKLDAARLGSFADHGYYFSKVEL